jgi:hypothetical protein
MISYIPEYRSIPLTFMDCYLCKTCDRPVKGFITKEKCCEMRRTFMKCPEGFR